MKQPTRYQLKEYSLAVEDWKEIVRLCRLFVGDTYDPKTEEYSPTHLAEMVAEWLDTQDGWFGVHDWLDDETHPIWDVAVDTCALADAGELDDE